MKRTNFTSPSIEINRLNIEITCLQLFTGISAFNNIYEISYNYPIYYILGHYKESLYQAVSMYFDPTM